MGFITHSYAHYETGRRFIFGRMMGLNVKLFLAMRISPTSLVGYVLGARLIEAKGYLT